MYIRYAIIPSGSNKLAIHILALVQGSKRFNIMASVKSTILNPSTIFHDIPLVKYHIITSRMYKTPCNINYKQPFVELNPPSLSLNLAQIYFKRKKHLNRFDCSSTTFNEDPPCARPTDSTISPRTAAGGSTSLE